MTNKQAHIGRASFAPLNEAQLRRSLYTTALQALLLPPLIGGSLMALVGFYPLPEFYFIFTDYTLLYVLAVTGLVMAQVPRWQRFIVGLPQLAPELVEGRARRAFARIPWLLLGSVTLYSMGGALSADWSLEHMGIRNYSLRGHLINQFGLIPVVLITAFPIFFYFVDRVGRYLGPRGVSVTAIPLWTKLLMLGIVTPLLIDSLLIGYYYNRTGYFQWETLGLWLSLLALAVGGTWIAWRSLQQGIAPLQAFIDAAGGSLAERARASLTPLSLDEFGVLAARYNELLTKQQELASNLRAAQSLADAVVANAGALVLVLDREGRIVRFNHAAEQLSGYVFAEVEGKFPWDTVLLPETAETIRREAFEALTSDPRKLSGTYINEWLGKDGRRHLLEWSNTVLLGSDGRMEFMVAIGMDVSERERAQRALVDHAAQLEDLVAARTQTLQVAQKQASDAATMLRGVLDATPSRIFWKDLAGRFLGGNQVFAEDSGLREPQGLVGLSDYDMSWKASADLYRADDAQVIASGTPKLNFEEPMDLPDGTRIWLATSKVPLRDGTGGIIGVLGAYDIITDRKNMEHALRDAAARLNAAQDVARVGDYVWDLRDNGLVWSDVAFDLLGFAPGSVTPSLELFESRIHPDDLPTVRENLGAVLTQMHVHDPDGRARLPDVEYRVVHPDGTVLWLHSKGIGELDAAGRVVRVLGTVQDVTTARRAADELVAAKEEAERASRAKSEFLSRMSHELRTPMNAILGFSQVLEEESLPPEQHDYVGEIHRAGDHLLELINGLLDLARIETDKLMMIVSPLQVAVVVEQAVRMVDGLFTAKQIIFLNKCDCDISVLADPTRLKQILINLLSNAAKYNRVGGRIVIACQPAGDDRLRIAVTDTGPGIAQENLARLFIPFERLGAEFSEVDGAGIGLALSHQLAQLMGGMLGVDTAPGEGSTFWVELPMAGTHAAEKSALPLPEKSTAAPETKSFTVLYVEDNAANMRLVEATLRHQPNLRLLSATNGEYGLELAKRYTPDVILLDIHLPGMDGYEVFDALKIDERTRNIPVIALSADAMPIDIERGLKAGFLHYLTKPVKVAELAETLKNAISQASAK